MLTNIKKNILNNRNDNPNKNLALVHCKFLLFMDYWCNNDPNNMSGYTSYVPFNMYFLKIEKKIIYFHKNY